MKPTFKYQMMQENIQSFLFDDAEGVVLYTHRTKSELVASRIVRNGFFYCDLFQKTTDPLVDDPVHFRYWQSLRKNYGDYVVVIGVDLELRLNCLNYLNNKGLQDMEVEQLLSKHSYNHTEKQDYFLLPPQYIKGFYNCVTDEVVENPLYNPSYFPKGLPVMRNTGIKRA